MYTPTWTYIAPFVFLVALGVAACGDGEQGSAPDAATMTDASTTTAPPTGDVSMTTAPGDATMATLDGGGDDAGIDLGPDPDTGGGGDTSMTMDQTIDMAPVDIEALSQPLGGSDRPAEVFVPENYHPSSAWPIVVLLHGYTESAAEVDALFGLTSLRTERGFIAVTPEGTRDLVAQRFWNATPYCCGSGRGDVDDVAYLWGLVDEARARFNIDDERVYFIGHSNGGFMAHRMACERGAGIASIASLAGVTFDDEDDRVGDGPVSVLQMHGTSDFVVAYGGSLFYPGAEETVERWVDRNGCGPNGTAGADLDLTPSSGDETSTELWSGCQRNTEVALWTLNGGGHMPTLTSSATHQILDFLFAHPRSP